MMACGNEQPGYLLAHLDNHSIPQLWQQTPSCPATCKASQVSSPQKSNLHTGGIESGFPFRPDIQLFCSQPVGKLNGQRPEILQQGRPPYQL